MEWPSSSVTIAFLVSLSRARAAAEHLDLALADQRVDGLDLDVEQALDGGLDLGLGRGPGHLEDDLVGFRDERRLLGDDRREDDVVGLELVIAAASERRLAVASAKRASSASTAALVSTSFLRRRMS